MEFLVDHAHVHLQIPTTNLVIDVSLNQTDKLRVNAHLGMLEDVVNSALLDILETH
mgnify:CR=1 FL=1